MHLIGLLGLVYVLDSHNSWNCRIDNGGLVIVRFVPCFLKFGQLMFDGVILVGVIMIGSNIIDRFMLNSNMPGNVMSNEVSYTTAYTQ